jgi:hypothetical protein
VNVPSLPRTGILRRSDAPTHAPRLLTNLPYSTADRAIMDSLIIGLAIAAALYIGVRLALRFYFPPDT